VFLSETKIIKINGKRKTFLEWRAERFFVGWGLWRLEGRRFIRVVRGVRVVRVR